MFYNQGVLSRVLPIHQIADTLETDVFSVLPAAHALNNCDSASKTGGKKTTYPVSSSEWFCWKSLTIP